MTIYRACPIALCVCQCGPRCSKCAGTVGTWPGNAWGSALSGGRIQLSREGGGKKKKQEIKIPIKEVFYMCWRTLMTERCLGSTVFETG